MKPQKFYSVDRGGCSKCGARPTVVCSRLCGVHHKERFDRMSPIALRAAQVRRERYPEQYPPNHADFFWRGYAHQIVNAAVKRGMLPALDGSIACVDCGVPAKNYDHRDYGRPLDVQPVCRSCNKARGTAIWPDKSQFNFPRIQQQKQAA